MDVLNIFLVVVILVVVVVGVVKTTELKFYVSKFSVIEMFSPQQKCQMSAVICIYLRGDCELGF